MFFYFQIHFFLKYLQPYFHLLIFFKHISIYIYIWTQKISNILLWVRLQVLNLLLVVFVFSCSFGGVLASLYAHDYPQYIYKLGLLAPGFKTPVYTKVSEELVQGNFQKFIPANSKELGNMLDLYCCNKPQFFSYPDVLLEAVMKAQYSPEQQELLRNRELMCLSQEIIIFSQTNNKKNSTLCFYLYSWWYMDCKYMNFF